MSAIPEFKISMCICYQLLILLVCLFSDLESKDITLVSAILKGV